MSLVDYIKTHFNCNNITTDSEGTHFIVISIKKVMRRRLYDLFKTNANIFTLETFNFDMFIDFIEQPFPLYYPNDDDYIWRLHEYFNTISKEKICFIKNGHLSFHHNSDVKFVAVICKQQFGIKAKFGRCTRPWILMNPRSIYGKMWEQLIYDLVKRISLDQILGVNLYLPKELSTIIGEYLTPQLEFGISWIDIIKGYGVTVSQIRESL